MVMMPELELVWRDFADYYENDRFPPPDQILNYNKSFGNRLRDGVNPSGWQPKADSHLFLREELDCEALLQICREYMTTDGLELVNRALFLSLTAHQSQYRDSGAPYSTHVLWITKALAQKYKMDEITIASALLHDVIEDTSLNTRDKLISALNQNEFWKESSELTERINLVGDTVYQLSQAEGSRQRKFIIDEESRMKVIASLLDNPRVAIIKIYDRLHNIRTLKDKKGGLKKRRRTINETLEVYIPLAKRLGLFDEAEELEEGCLRNFSQRHDEIADSILVAREEYFKNFPLAKLQHDIDTTLSNSEITVVLRRPNIYDIYRRMEKLREPLTRDFYLNIDIIMDEFTTVNSKAWGPKALGILDNIVFPADVDFKFDLIEAINEMQFREEVVGNLTDSLTFKVRYRENGTELKVNVFPRIYYDQENLIVTSMYYRRPPTLADFNLEEIHLGDEAGFRRFNAFEKKERYAEILRQFQAGTLTSAQILRFFEPRPSPDFVPVWGKNPEGVQEAWLFKKGSTVLDYAREIFQQNRGKGQGRWPTITRAEVNGQTVPLNYALKPYEVVTIHRDSENKDHWDPRWIYYFQTDEEGIREVRARYNRELRRLKIESESKRRGNGLRNEEQLIKNRIKQVGLWRIEQDLLEIDRPLRVGLGRAMGIVRVGYKSDIDEEDFLYDVGRRVVPDDVIRAVAEILTPFNRNIWGYDVYFDHDKPGQAEAVLARVRKAGISVQSNSIKVEVLGAGGGSVVTFYLPAEDHTEYGDSLIEAIKKDRTCRERGILGIAEPKRVGSG